MKNVSCLLIRQLLMVISLSPNFLKIHLHCKVNQDYMKQQNSFMKSEYFLLFHMWIVKNVISLIHCRLSHHGMF